MNNRENIDKKVDEVLSSLDGATRASAKPYLFTRLNARMQRENESGWERAGRFIARPVVAFAGLCLIIGINAAVIAFDEPESTTTTVSEQPATADEVSSTFATLYEIENP